MDDSDFQFLSEMAARCLERASRARDEKGRALWLELAGEIADRLLQAWPGDRPTPGKAIRARAH
ncbi:MAG: hypothetical protein K2Y27_15805 [Xanthobacteraceae bacterium]|nr:hypothetical protein [Xanthobacteraceae bacterium]